MIAVPDRDERHVQALVHSLRAELERGAPLDQLSELTRAAMGADKASGVIAACRDWVDAVARARTCAPTEPDAEWLRREAERLWIAYEAAVDQAT